jgi:hypothetical protein
MVCYCNSRQFCFILFLFYFAAQADWSTEGIALSGDSEGPIPLSDFHLLFNTVFTDITGYVNLSGNLSLATFLNVSYTSNIPKQDTESLEVKTNINCGTANYNMYFY